MFWQSLLKLKAHCNTMSRVRRLTLSNSITGSLFIAKVDHLFCVRRERGRERERRDGRERKKGEMGGREEEEARI